MEGLLTLLLFAGLFYFMMRFGCGAHAVHRQVRRESRALRGCPRRCAMKPGLSLSAFGHATSLFLALTFVLCVGFDLLFPQQAMYRSWQALLPGFTWIRW